MAAPFELTSSILDVQAYLAQKLPPAEILDREKRLWLIRQNPIDLPEEKPHVDWTWCDKGDVIRIPLVPYCSRADDPAVLVGYAWELGFKAARYIQPNYELVRCHLSLGSPVEEAKIDGMPVLRAWIGFAYVLREIK